MHHIWHGPGRSSKRVITISVKFYQKLRRSPELMGLQVEPRRPLFEPLAVAKDPGLGRAEASQSRTTGMAEFHPVQQFATAAPNAR